MGIRILASVIVTFAALNGEAATLPAVPPLKLADLVLQVPASPLNSLPASSATSFRDVHQSVDAARWRNERQTLVQQQRWVF
ncbi:hypothetical protein [Pseudomonas oryzihabitans]|uniref:hypothetical protein n=1 Tax=Pseudomonas oryzihabitans TaxID=47885 RepID=UPI00289E711B|nr:hypothetical protein [Pseudomonas oryzihabitans]